MTRANSTDITELLSAIRTRAQVGAKRNLTHKELADIAGVSKRSIDEWMRGAIVPPGMRATFKLLSCLSDEDVVQVVETWRKMQAKGSAV